MRKTVELLTYLIKKTVDGSIEWKEMDYADYNVDCKTYEDFINSKDLCNPTAISALRAVTPMNVAAVATNSNINVCYGFINGLELYMIENVDYSMSFPRRNYSLRLIRMDTENKRKSFNQLVTDTNLRVPAALELLDRLAALVFNMPVDEARNADDFISYLIDNDNNS